MKRRVEKRHAMWAGALSVVLACLAAVLAGCGDDYLALVVVSPGSATAVLGREVAFSANVIGREDKRVSWAVNGRIGGDDTYGTINQDGVYTAPVHVPADSTVTITAACVSDASVYGTATVTVIYSAFVTVTPDSSAVGLQGQVAFSAAVIGPQDKRVRWAVNGQAGGDQVYGTITADGLYTAPLHFPDNPEVTVTAACVSDPYVTGDASVTIVNSVLVEMEDFTSSFDQGGGAIRKVGCSAASGGMAVEGFDSVGDHMIFQVTFDSPGNYAAVLRQAAESGAHSHVEMTLEGAGPGGVDQASLFEIDGKGIT